MSRRTPVLAMLLAAALAPPAAAHAQGGDPVGDAVGSATSSAKAPEEADVDLRLGHLRGGKAKILSRIPISGTLSPFVAGQEVDLLFFRNGRQVGSETVKVHSGKGNFGVFETKFRVRRAGRFAVQAVHDATDDQKGAASVRKKFGVRFPGLGSSECGRVARGFKRNLSRLGYVPGGGSCMSDRSGRAVLAYRKVNGYGHNQHAGAAIVKRVFAGKGRFHPKHPDAGEHVEVSIGRQVIVFINKQGRAVETYHVSTGKSSTPTVTGRFTFYLRQPGTNSHGMVHSTYFHGGYAVHGYPSVPATYPASHGCVRVPIPDALHIYSKIFLGETIYVY
ncbi:MAG: L,D-transpeptidase [Actinomycetota bacterium]